MSLRIDEYIIGVPADLGAHEPAAGSRLERLESGRFPEHCDHALVCRVEGERVVRAEVPGRPARELSSLRDADHGDLGGVRNVDQDPVFGRIELEAFGMAVQSDICDLRTGPGVDDCERRSESDVDTIGHGIDAHVVRVGPERNPVEQAEILGTEYSQRAIATVCDVHGIGRRLVGNPLRRVETRHRAHETTPLQVDDTDAVVAKLGDVHAVAPRIEREMIDASADVAQGDLCFDA
jgi:hypothetical protein